MDIRIIVFGMCFVLIALFIGAKFFVPREKEHSIKEGLFAQSTKNFHENPTSENYQACFNAAKELSNLKNQDELSIKAYLKKNGISL